jgi:hypothetical protein
MKDNLVRVLRKKEAGPPKEATVDRPQLLHQA